MSTVAPKAMTDKEIQASKDFQTNVEKCSKNLRGDYSFQVICFAMKDTQTKFGNRGAKLLLDQVPAIRNIIVVPAEILNA